jgi:hypothetical protein
VVDKLIISHKNWHDQAIVPQRPLLVPLESFKG